MRSRTTTMVAIALAVAAAAVGAWTLGVVTDSPLLRFIGLMIGATTFVPLPADTFVLAASDSLVPIIIGVIGGLINGTMVLVERRWLLLMLEFSWFDRFRAFFDTNRFVAWTERNMFVALIVGGASFIPFEPFRLIAVMSGYSPPKYFAATFIARGGRYFVLASLGEALLEYGLLRQAIWFTFGLFVFGLWRSGVKLIRGSKPSEEVDQPWTT